MKNLHYLKKFVVMVLAAMMTLSTFALPTFAEKVDDTKIKVSGLPTSGVTVKAYKLIKQDETGKWIPANNLNAAKLGIDAKTNKVKIDSTSVLEFAQKTDWPANSAITGFSVEGGNWVKNLPNPTGKTYGESDTTGAGMYLVLVENTATNDKLDNADAAGMVEVYNPMIVSIDPRGNEGGLVGGTVESDKSFVISEKDGSGTSGTAYAKSSKPSFDKYILRKNDVAPNANVSQLADLANTTNPKNESVSGEGKYGDTDTTGGDTDNTDPKVGSKVWYEIKTTIPAYADSYFQGTKAPKFNVYDKLSRGLSFNDDIEIFTVSGNDVNKVASGNYNVVKTNIGDNDYKVEFKSDFLKGGVQKEIVIRYSATVQEGCATNFEPETNTAKIEYTHKPWEETESEEITTYHYTFTINGTIDGEGSSVLRELVKVGCTEDTQFVYEETKYEENKYQEPIAGAVFRMYTKDQMKADLKAPKDKNVYYREGTSQSDGRITGFDELDAGEYYIVEQSVPSPYKVKSEPIKVVISAVLDDATGLLKEYTITVGEVTAAHYEAEYDNDGNIVTINDKAAAVFKAGTHEAFNQAEETVLDVEAAHIQNTKTGTLPSTGGMGTVLFTIGGVAIMALALFLLFGGKKKQHQK